MEINKNKLFANLTNSLFNDSKSLLSSYTYWKKDKSYQGYIEFSIQVLPFDGNFAFMAGIDEITNLLENFNFSQNDLDFLSDSFPYLDKDYFAYLKQIQLQKEVKLFGLDNGEEYKKDEPVLILQGPITLLKLLTFPISNLFSFSSLICTNSVRMRITSKIEKNIYLMEFGLRRAQGPLAGIHASKYSYLGNFNAVSNVIAAQYYNIPCRGTCAHAYIMSYQGLDYSDLQNLVNEIKNPLTKSLFEESLKIRNELKWEYTNLSELLAFVTFASVYKSSSNLLVDTYNTIDSGVKNAIILGLAMNKINLKIKAIRLDSGDLADLSKKAKALFDQIAEETGVKQISEIVVTASNDINEKSISNFNKTGHNISSFGIGTNLVTCQLQPFMYVKATTHLKSINHLEGRKEFKLLFEDGKCFNQFDLEISRKKLEENLILMIPDINLHVSQSELNK